VFILSPSNSRSQDIFRLNRPIHVSRDPNTTFWDEANFTLHLRLDIHGWRDILTQPYPLSTPPESLYKGGAPAIRRPQAAPPRVRGSAEGISMTPAPTIPSSSTERSSQPQYRMPITSRAAPAASSTKTTSVGCTRPWLPIMTLSLWKNPILPRRSRLTCATGRTTRV